MDGLYEQFRIALHQVWRRRWLAIAVAWGVAVLGWLVIALIPNSYEAKARLVRPDAVDPAQPDRHHPGRAHEPAAAAQADADLERESRPGRPPHRSQLAGRQRARHVERRLGAAPAHHRHRPAGRHDRDQGDLEHFRLLQRPERAHRRGDRPGPDRPFVEQNLSGDRRETGQSLQFLDEELRRREAALREAEQRRVEFEQRFMGMLPGWARSPSACRRRGPSSPISSSRSSPPTAASMRCAPSSPRRRRPCRAVGDGGSTASGQIAQIEGQVAQNLARGWTDRIPTSSPRAPAGRAIAALCPGRAAQRHRAACPIPPMSRCAR